MPNLTDEQKAKMNEIKDAIEKKFPPNSAGKPIQHPTPSVESNPNVDASRDAQTTPAPTPPPLDLNVTLTAKVKLLELLTECINTIDPIMSIKNDNLIKLRGKIDGALHHTHQIN